MKKSQRNKVYGLGGLLGVTTLIFLGVFASGGSSEFLNTSQLSFVESSRDISCEAFNEILEDGVLKASGRDGFNPLVDTSTLSLSSSSGSVESITIRLVLVCDGDFLDDSSSSTVQGQFQMLLCGDPQNGGTKCIASNDRLFTTLNGQASSTSSFAQVPIDATQIQADVPKVIYTGNISAGFLETLFPEGSGNIVIISKMYPQLTFLFNHPSGTIRATQDSFATNDQVYAQYNGLTNNAPPPPDTDGDGIIDSNDSCTGQAEDFNGFEDADGCPDAFKLIDSDGDGVTDVNDACPNVQGLGSLQGCPPVDTDGDGVVDVDDNCPDESGSSEFGGCPDVDTDGDGINDFSDDCPNEFGIESLDGCPDSNAPTPTVEFCQTFGQTNCTPTDSDNDGVTNSQDLCPSTSANATVDASGCELITDDIVVSNPTVTLIDTDGDGVLDSSDQCPTLRGSILNSGCPDSPEDDTNPFAGIEDLFTPTPETTTPDTNIPQTTTDRRTDQISDNIISGIDDFTVFVVFSMVGIIVVVGIIVGTGKAKL